MSRKKAVNTVSDDALVKRINRGFTDAEGRTCERHVAHVQRNSLFSQPRRPDTTLESYIKDVPESVFSMADAMYEKIAGPVEPEILAIEHFLNTRESGQSLSN